ncbi:hypothetical protein [Geobacillus sp. YF-1]|uniref:hypothetical protein n=1 Tax=Geobacillus sp. YF-1 TaxID=3457480 RepID=UPI0040467AD7
MEKLHGQRDLPSTQQMKISRQPGILEMKSPVFHTKSPFFSKAGEKRRSFLANAQSRQLRSERHQVASFENLSDEASGSFHYHPLEG